MKKIILSLFCTICIIIYASLYMFSLSKDLSINNIFKRFHDLEINPGLNILEYKHDDIFLNSACRFYIAENFSINYVNELIDLSSDVVRQEAKKISISILNNISNDINLNYESLILVFYSPEYVCQTIVYYDELGSLFYIINRTSLPFLF